MLLNQSALRLSILTAAEPVTKTIGKIHSPFSHKEVRAIHYRAAHQVLIPGTVLTTRTNGEFSNLVIPGYWSHAAIYAGGDSVVEAVGKGVVETDLIDFMLSKDHIAGFVPLFATHEQMAAAARWAMAQKGLPYDYCLTMALRAFYCSKLGYMAYLNSVPDCPWKLRKTWDVETVTPDDYAKATKLWRKVLDTKSSLVTA